MTLPAARRASGPAFIWTSVGSRVEAKRTGPSERSFGVSVGIVLLAAAAFSGWRGHLIRAEVAGAVGGLLLLIGLVRPRMLAALSRGWMRIGGAIGWFNSRVLLTVMFGLILAPLGLAARVLGNDPLVRRRPRGSRWVAYPQRFQDPKHFERLF